MTAVIKWLSMEHIENHFGSTAAGGCSASFLLLVYAILTWPDMAAGGDGD